jgi:hypothetical protein
MTRHSTQLHSCLRHSTRLSTTTRSMILRCLLSSEVWRSGRHYLEGVQHLVKIWTDHKNLEYFRFTQKLNCQQARWSLYLSRFDFTLLMILVAAWVSPTHCCTEQITDLDLDKATMTTSLPCCQHCSTFMHCQAHDLRVTSATSEGRSYRVYDMMCKMNQ